PGTIASSYRFHRRSDNAMGNTWGSGQRADSVIINPIEQIRFASGLEISTFGQFVLSNASAEGWIGVFDTDWHNPRNWARDRIPLTSDHVIIPAFTPFQPVVSQNVSIRSLLMQPSSTLEILNNSLFNTLEN
ncbi:MAG: hypothetical protein AAGK97_08585, partial [Bacteroidota bacterium]